MSVTIHCPHCGAAGNAPDNIVGQTVRCSKCKQAFVAGGGGHAAHIEPAHEPAPRSRRHADDDADDFDDRPIRKSRGSSGGGGFGDILMFRKMIAPTLIIILFWLQVAGLVVFLLLGMIASFMQGGMGILIGILTFLFGLPLGLLVIRVSAEFMIVVFRIYEVLKERS